MMKATKCLIIILAIGGFSLLSYGQLPVEYLRLTKKNLPNSQELIRACMKFLDFDAESAREQHKRSRLSALLPSIMQVGVNVAEDSVLQREYVQGYQVLEQTRADGSTQFVQTYDQFVPTGFNDRMTYTGILEWDLSNLVIHQQDSLIETANISKEDQRHFLVDDVSKRYAILWNMLPAEPGESLPESEVFKVIENAGILDAMSGGLIARRMQELQDEEAVFVSGIDDDFEVTVQNAIEQVDAEKVDAEKVLDIGDGVDDTIEKVGQ